jgi:hypothetical protein
VGQPFPIFSSFGFPPQTLLGQKHDRARGFGVLRDAKSQYQNSVPRGGRLSPAQMRRRAHRKVQPGPGRLPTSNPDSHPAWTKSALGFGVPSRQDLSPQTGTFIVCDLGPARARRSRADPLKSQCYRRGETGFSLLVIDNNGVMCDVYPYTRLQRVLKIVGN